MDLVPQLRSQSRTVVGNNGSCRSIEVIGGGFSEALENAGITTIFTRLLQRCILNEDLIQGRTVHRLIIQRGLDVDTVLGGHLLRMFSSNGSLLEARHVFSKLANPNVFSWSAIISAHAKLGEDDQALQLYQKMRTLSVYADGHVFTAVLKACAHKSTLSQGKQIHSHVIESGFDCDIFVGNSVIDMYAKCESLKDAYHVFHNLPKGDAVSWNAMISGYIHHGFDEDALHLFQQMCREGLVPTRVTFVCVLKACSSTAALDKGMLIHSCIVQIVCELDLAVANTLTDMYGKCGSFDDAHRLFNGLPRRNLITWNAILSGCAEHGYGHDAIQHFHQMQQEGLEPDKVTFVCILKASSLVEALFVGNLIHMHAMSLGLEQDISIGNALIDMYAKCGNLDDAFKIFKTLGKQDIVTWNSMLTGFYQHGHGTKALQLFHQMQGERIEPSRVTFVCILKACSGTAALDQSKLIHACIIESGFESDVYVSNTLIDIYTKCSSIEDARRVFDKSPKQDLVTLNTMVTGYAQHGSGQEALQLLLHMEQETLEPDKITFICILKACSIMSAPNRGKLIHAHITRIGADVFISIGNTLIDMYANCGSIMDARNVFDKLQNRNVVTWSAMISGYAQHSCHSLALQFFVEMQHEGIKPDFITFTCLLSACNHMGKVNKGNCHFTAMIQDYHITPTLEHYNCMLDLLGRAGCLKETRFILKIMPFQPNIPGWISLLGHCMTHGNVEVGRRCFDHIVTIDSGTTTAYVLMANIYAHAGMWEDSGKIKEQRHCVNAWKIPGTASIEVGSKVHDFTVRDMSHVEIDSMHSKLKRLRVQYEKEGYMPSLD